MLGLALDAENSVLHKTDKKVCPHEAYILMGGDRQKISCVVYWEIMCYIGK